MSDLRFQTSGTAAFAAQIEAANLKLPLRPDPANIGCVVDADGRDVFTVDVGGARPDEEADLIAHWIILVVNTCGGFKAVFAEGER